MISERVFIPEDRFSTPTQHAESIVNCYWWYNEQGLLFIRQIGRLYPQYNQQESVMQYMLNYKVVLYEGLLYRKVDAVFLPYGYQHLSNEALNLG